MTCHHENHTHTPDHKNCCSGSSGSSLVFLLLGLAAGIAGSMIAKRLLGNKKPKQASIEDLRKAYAGLGPDEE